MLSSLVDQLCRDLLDKTGFSGDRVSYFDLTRPDADDVVSKIFQWRFETLFSEEKKRLESGPKAFAFDSPAIQKAIQQYLTELKKSRMFTREEVRGELHTALEARMNYIIKPLETTENLMFAESGARAVEEIVGCMKEFGKYRYYPDALQKYAAAKSMSHLTRGQFRMLITEINQSLFNKDNLDNILKVCGLIMKEINDLRGQSAQTLPTELLMEAFRDRSLHDFEVALNIEKELGNEEINIYGLRQVLSRFMILKEKAPGTETQESAVKPAKEPYGVSAAPDTSKPADKTVTRETAPTKKDEDSGELIDFNMVLHSHTGETKTGQTASVQPAAVSDEIDRDVTGEFIREELVPKFSDDTKSVKILNLKEAEVPEPVENLITPKDEKIFLKKIFSGNQTMYEEFISRINALKRWKHAMKDIDEVLYRQKVDPFSREAVRLSDIVYQRFYPPEEN